MSLAVTCTGMPAKRKSLPEYFVWKAMRQRCQNSRDKNFLRYGGRGITVDPRWQDFANFLADMGRRPAKHSIERIDNDGPYSPNNCRWASQREQCRNRSSNIIVEFEGQSMTLVELAERTGLPWMFLYHRIVTWNWNVSEAVSKPKHARRSAQ